MVLTRLARRTAAALSLSAVLWAFACGLSPQPHPPGADENAPTYRGDDRNTDAAAAMAPAKDASPPNIGEASDAGADGESDASGDGATDASTD